MTERIVAWVARDLDGLWLFLEEPNYTEVSHEWLGWADVSGRRGKMIDHNLFPGVRQEEKKVVYITIDDTEEQP